MPFAEDMSAFFDADLGFATSGTLGGAVVRGIFDNGAQNFAFSESGAAATAPTFLLSTVQVPANVTSLSLVLGADTWRVTDAQPDGTGITTLVLRKP